jgi:hypothetical protein
VAVQRSQHAWFYCVALATALFSTLSVAAPGAAPFRATIAFTEQVVPTTTNANCALTGTISGVGTEPKIGTVHLTSVDCINPLSPTSFLFLSDEVVLAADGGDQIWAAYGGTLSATDGVIKGTYFIFGGTGRFANAAGVGKIDGFEAIDFLTGAGRGQIQLKGTLGY